MHDPGATRRGTEISCRIRSSLRAKRSNPGCSAAAVWIASSLRALAMTECLGCYAALATAPWACLSIASMMSGHLRSGSA